MTDGRRIVQSKDVPPLDDEESLWISPVKDEISHNTQNAPGRPNNTKHADAEQVYESRLQTELANVKKVNEAMEGVVASLEQAQRNMKSVNEAVISASSLLNIWTRILSQTEHNHRLILDPSWQGASQDIVDIEEEATARQQAAEREKAEDQERRAAAAKKAEEEEAKKRLETTVPKPKSSIRGRTGVGRGSGIARSGSATSGSYTATTSSVARGVSGTRRAPSGLTRGARGRGT